VKGAIDVQDREVVFEEKNMRIDCAENETECKRSELNPTIFIDADEFLETPKERASFH
jgi:hypothetical protein